MNQVVLMGRLTKDPELRYTATGNKAVCSFTLAVDKFSNGEKQADFIPVVTWDKIAESCSKFLTKGRKVAIVGRISTRNWEDKEGKKHYVTEVIADQMHFADSKKENNASDEESEAPKDGNKQASSKNNYDATQKATPPPASSKAPPPWARK